MIFETGAARYLLPREVMEEIPNQFIYYMEENNIQPNNEYKKSDPKKFSMKIIRIVGGFSFISFYLFKFFLKYYLLYNIIHI